MADSKNLKDAEKLAELLMRLENKKDMRDFLLDILTPAERAHILERWDIVRALLEGKTHRAVKDELGVSISKVSRGARILQEGRGAFQKLVK